MLWAITCVDNRDTAALREQHMQVHRAYLDRQKSILVLEGKSPGLPWPKLMSVRQNQIASLQIC
jgi:hypothetical protein